MMLESEKILAGPLMSFSGSFRRFFIGKPLWLQLTFIPFAWLMWAIFACTFYYLGGWLFFKHGKQRRLAVDQARHREILEARRNTFYG